MQPVSVILTLFVMDTSHLFSECDHPNCTSQRCYRLRRIAEIVSFEKEIYGFFRKLDSGELFKFLYCVHLWINHLLLDVSPRRSKFLPVFTCLPDLYKLLCCTIVIAVRKGHIRHIHRDGKLVTIYSAKFPTAVGSFIHHDPTIGLLNQFEVKLVFEDGCFANAYCFGHGYKVSNFGNKSREDFTAYPYPRRQEYIGSVPQPQSSGSMGQYAPLRATTSFQSACASALSHCNPEVQRRLSTAEAERRDTSTEPLSSPSYQIQSTATETTEFGAVHNKPSTGGPMHVPEVLGQVFTSPRGMQMSPMHQPSSIKMGQVEGREPGYIQHQISGTPRYNNPLIGYPQEFGQHPYAQNSPPLHRKSTTNGLSIPISPTRTCSKR